jgi:hypothetical protein
MSNSLSHTQNAVTTYVNGYSRRNVDNVKRLLRLQRVRIRYIHGPLINLLLKHVYYISYLGIMITGIKDDWLVVV